MAWTLRKQVFVYLLWLRVSCSLSWILITGYSGTLDPPAGWQKCATTFDLTLGGFERMENVNTQSWRYQWRTKRHMPCSKYWRALGVCARGAARGERKKIKTAIGESHGNASWFIHWNSQFSNNKQRTFQRREGNKEVSWGQNFVEGSVDEHEHQAETELDVSQDTCGGREDWTFDSRDWREYRGEAHPVEV